MVIYIVTHLTPSSIPPTSPRVALPVVVAVLRRILAPDVVGDGVAHARLVSLGGAECVALGQSGEPLHGAVPQAWAGIKNEGGYVCVWGGVRVILEALQGKACICQVTRCI